MVEARRALISADRIIQICTGSRWFGDKGRVITSASVVWSHVLAGSDTAALIVVHLEFADGEPSLYAIPIDLVSGEEITADSRFTTWLHDATTRGIDIGGELSWEKLGTAHIPMASPPIGRLLGVEQSNTSIRYGERLLIKLNRKLSFGQSPEVELAAVIAKTPNQDFAPNTYSMLTLTGVGSESICLAIASEFVQNTGDAWAGILELLSGTEGSRQLALEDVRAIADATGKMHLGLLGDPWRKDVAAEPIRPEHISEWESAAKLALEKLAGSLESNESASDERSAELIPLLNASLPVLQDQLSGFQALAGTYRMRVHGDYHLGQVMKAVDGRFVIVDFDGEPHRPLLERRQKYSALKDVAGMLRSLAYARGTVEQRSGPLEKADLRSWEQDARTVFLTSYLEAIQGAPVPIVPGAFDDVRRALTAIEIEKAIYECGYELSNRPAWLWLPLSRLVTAR